MKKISIEELQYLEFLEDIFIKQFEFLKTFKFELESIAYKRSEIVPLNLHIRMYNLSSRRSLVLTAILPETMNEVVLSFYIYRMVNSQDADVFDCQIFAKKSNSSIANHFSYNFDSLENFKSLSIEKFKIISEYIKKELNSVITGKDWLEGYYLDWTDY